MTDFIWDLFQQRQIREARTTADQAARDSRDAATRLGLLERRLEMLALANAALWELLSERTGLGKDELIRRMQEIDQRDGRADGKMKAAVKTCAACDRPNHASRLYCVYCGESLV